MNEIWKDIEGFEGWYQVSNKGQVRSLDRYVNHRSGGDRFMKGRILSHSIRSGYCEVSLWINGEQTGKSIHRLVAETFLPNPNDYPCVNHKDGIKTNNDVSNLEWCTYSENHIHARRTGLNKYYGQSHHFSKLKKDDIPNILDSAKCGIPVKAIARKFGVSDGSIYNIVNGKTWKHLSNY